MLACVSSPTASISRTSWDCARSAPAMAGRGNTRLFVRRSTISAGSRTTNLTRAGPPTRVLAQPTALRPGQPDPSVHTRLPIPSLPTVALVTSDGTDSLLSSVTCDGSSPPAGLRSPTAAPCPVARSTRAHRRITDVSIVSPRTATDSHAIARDRRHAPASRTETVDRPGRWSIHAPVRPAFLPSVAPSVPPCPARTLAAGWSRVRTSLYGPGICDRRPAPDLLPGAVLPRPGAVAVTSRVSCNAAPPPSQQVRPMGPPAVPRPTAITDARHPSRDRGRSSRRAPPGPLLKDLSSARRCRGYHARHTILATVSRARSTPRSSAQARRAPRPAGGL
jgi:hypothetical protein